METPACTSAPAGCAVMRSHFYTYLYLRLDGSPYYVGKGKQGRAFHKAGHWVPVPSVDRIIIQEFPDEAAAFAAEVFLISFYGRKNLGTGSLLNRTDGGEGPAGRVWKPSEETRKRMSAASKGIKNSFYGCKHTEETITKCREAGYKSKGRKKTAATKKLIGKATRGNRSRRGQKQSQEERDKRATSMRLFWIKKRGVL